MILPIEETIVDLSNGHKPLLNSRLAELSSLNAEEMELFKRSWQSITPERRRQTIHRLVELAEDNLELNFDSIFKFCLNDQDKEVRNKAIEGLWENEEAALIAPLINLLEQDSSEKVQATAATALGKFTILAEHKKLRPEHMLRLQEALLAVIGDKRKPVEVRRRALEAIAPLSLPQVKTAIADAHQSHNSRLRISSIYAMGQNCNPSWMPILLEELFNSDAEVRYEAAGACGELGEEEAVPFLVKLIDDLDVDVQMAAIQALGKIGDIQAKRCLEQCLDNSSKVISQAARLALNELEVKEDPLSFRISNT